MEGGAGVLRQHDAGETLPPNVLDDVYERDDPGDALGEVAPVAGPGVKIDIYASAEGDPDAVSSVEGQRDEDEDPLQHAHQRQRVEELDLLSVRQRTVERLEVGEEMLQQERADGDDAGERVQPAPEERVAHAGTQRPDPGLYRVRGRMGGCGGRGCCHRRCSSVMPLKPLIDEGGERSATAIGLFRFRKTSVKLFRDDVCDYRLRCARSEE